MKTITYNTEPILIPYDDNNIFHALAGPDYGQPWGDGWSIEDTTEWFLEKIDNETIDELVLENFSVL